MTQFEKFLGKTLSEARLLCPDNIIRVVKRDGNDVICLRNFDPDRINVEETKGIITAIIGQG